MTPAPLRDLVASGLGRSAGAGRARRSPRSASSCEPRSAAGRRFLPAGDAILRAFTRPLAEVKVLIVGQDPYPTPGHPVGLCFSVERDVRPLPRSLENIYRELRDDQGIETPEHGDLSAWADQGVLLLNRVLTVRAGSPGLASGQGLGVGHRPGDRWSGTPRRRPGGDPVGPRRPVAAPALGSTPVIASPHPSPLSASRGFFGSRPFSRANAALTAARRHARRLASDVASPYHHRRAGSDAVSHAGTPRDLGRGAAPRSAPDADGGAQPARRRRGRLPAHAAPRRRLGLSSTPRPRRRWSARSRTGSP